MGGGGGVIFFNALFLRTFFRESDITCIITVVGAQKQHKGMFFGVFLKWGGGGGGDTFFQLVMGEGIFFPVYS